VTGNLRPALLALLHGALPSLLGGAEAPVKLSVLAGDFVLDASSTDTEAGQPRSDAATDSLPFNAAQPQGPYRLTRVPDLSMRKVRLTTAAGDRIGLHDSEVLPDPLDARNFSLALRPTRNLEAVNGVLVLYGVTAVFATLKYVQQLRLRLVAADPTVLDRAEALAMAVLALHRPGLMNDAAKSELADTYGAQVALKALHFVGGDAPDEGSRQIQLRADYELKALRALADGEGAPIRHIRAPGSSSTRPVDIRPQVDT